MSIEKGFTGNQLKILAMFAMTCDHVGLQLLPDWWILRIIGRLALPIFAYMIAEGCRHTRNRAKYLLRIAGLATLCQLVYYFAIGSLYMSILVTFSLSVCLIYAVDNAQRKKTVGAKALALGLLLAIAFLVIVLPWLLPGTDYAIDYGFMGILLPVLVYYGTEKTKSLTAGLFLLALQMGGLQWFSLAAVPVLGMYNGQRGEKNIGMLFYLYYPLHLVVIYGLSLLF